MARVGCQPPPLHGALLALQPRRKLVLHLEDRMVGIALRRGCVRIWWDVPPRGIVQVQRLTVGVCLQRDALALRSVCRVGAHERVLVEARLPCHLALGVGVENLVADLELEEPFVVCRYADLEFNHVAFYECGLDVPRRHERLVRDGLKEPVRLRKRLKRVATQPVRALGTGDLILSWEVAVGLKETLRHQRCPSALTTVRAIS
mmetsp:Transcript_15956/g.38106  ORF Transcript_15956/g.38106 Transcript_15956/m.38106 type:complete len:204 (+) Transcript_15956:576-1187(+)